VQLQGFYVHHSFLTVVVLRPIDYYGLAIEPKVNGFLATCDVVEQQLLRHLFKLVFGSAYFVSKRPFCFDSFLKELLKRTISVEKTKTSMHLY